MQPNLIIKTTLLSLTLNLIQAGNAIPNSKAIHCAGYYPTQNDLHSLLHSLGKIINFSFAHCTELDLIMLIGLFFVDVNLRFTNNDSMPPSYHIRLKSLLDKNHKAIACIYKNQVDPIVTLFKSARTWYTRQKSLKLKKHPKEEIPIDTELKGYPDWETYLRIVFDWDGLSPAPVVSRNCLTRLAENVVKSSVERPVCRIPQICHEMLIDGSNHGYALTRRLLLLIGAQFGRGCSIFSDQQDKAMRNKFCEMMYVEAHYIAENGFQLVDLMLEQIALCSLDGHSEFISRHWITSSIQRFQTPHGCFRQPLTLPKNFILASELRTKFSSVDEIPKSYNNTYKNFGVNDKMNVPTVLIIVARDLRSSIIGHWMMMQKPVSSLVAQ